MSTVTRVSPAEAQKLVEEGYAYLDVCSVEEFLAGHPRGAVNIPLLLPSPGGMKENPEFLSLAGRALGQSAKIVVGCATGVRSLRGAKLLLSAGFFHVVDQRAGLLGARGTFGELIEPGWAAAGFPVTRGEDSGTYADLCRRFPSLG